MTRQYIGARYVPIIDGEYNSEKVYEPLTIVTYNGSSYTSKKSVPAGTLPTNTEYWALTGNYNAQVEAYRQEVLDFKEELSTYVTPEMFGAVGDGITDDLTALQQAFTVGNVLLLNKNYAVSDTLTVANDLTIISNNATISALASGFSSTESSLIEVSHDNFSVNGVLNLEMPYATYTSGEHRHALFFNNANNCRLDTVNVDGTGGDGLYFGGDAGASSNITIQSANINHAYRNGVAFTNAKHITIDNLVVSNTVGTAPQSGIDFEPYENTHYLDDININHAYTSGSGASGLLFSFQKLADTSNTVNIHIGDYTSDTDLGTENPVSFTYPNTADTGTVKGVIAIDRMTVINAKTMPVSINNWSYYLPMIDIGILEVVNAMRTSSSASITNTIVYFTRYTSETTVLGNVHIGNIIVKGNETKLNSYLYNNSSKPLRFVQIDSVLGSIARPASYSRFATGLTNGTISMPLDYDAITVSGSSIGAANYPFELVTGNQSTSVVLPDATQRIHSKYMFVNTVANSTMTLTAQSGQNIYSSNGVAQTMEVAYGQLVTLYSAGGRWYVI
jgi:hypothetical protein